MVRRGHLILLLVFMADITSYLLAPDGEIPNHPQYPLLLYGGAFSTDAGSGPIQERFASNDWNNSWINGVFSYHHFHTTAHEVLGCFRGAATVQFGGESGPEVAVEAGSVVVIPAGVAHRNLEASPDFGVVGAYPEGTRNDLCTGHGESRSTLLERIERVPMPEKDPVHGETGPLFEYWKGLSD